MTQKTYTFEPPAISAIPVRDHSQWFPVRRIYCVGRNYADHVIEMGHDPMREAPFFFQKPADAIVQDGGEFPYPSSSSDVHHEVELVVALKSGGANIPPDAALDHVFGYGVGIDMTRRDLQGEAKKAGRPWEVGKAFDHAAPCSALVAVATIGHPAKAAIRLSVNGVVKQDGDLGQMTWNVPSIIAHLSRLFALKAGDIIYTGTPAGVGPVKRGDKLHGMIAGIGDVRVTVT